MSIYKAPDGTEYNIPTEPEKRDYFAKAILATYGEDINQTDTLGRIKEFAKAIPREAVGTAQRVPIGLSQLFDMGNDSPMTEHFLKQQEEWRTEGPFAGDPAYQDLYSTKLGAGLGSFIPFVGAGLAGRALTARGVGANLPRLLQPDITLPYALAGPGGVSEAAELMQEARESGTEIGPIKEVIAELGGALIGATELYPIEKLLKRVPKNALRYPDIRNMLMSAVQQGGIEAGQEMFAGISQRLLARGLYSDDLPLLESAWDDFSVGGGVGFIADLALNSVSRRSRGRNYLRDQEQKARDNRINLNSADKFQEGVTQGTLEEIQDQPVATKPEIPIPALVGTSPALEVIQNPDGKFSVVDLNATESPVIQTFKGEADALVFKNKQQTDFLREQLAVDIANATYALGMPKSKVGLQIGSTILDPNSTEINLQSLIDFDSRLSDDLKKKYAAERKEAGWFGKNVPSEMIDRKKSFLTETSKYLNSKGLDLKASYSMAEVKKVLSAKDYNSLLRDWTAEVFQATEESETESQPSIIADKEKPNVNLKYIKDIAASKNIDLDFKDPAVRYAALRWTGTADISKTRNRGVKELFLARLHSFEKFNNRTKFPDFRPRKYTGQDVANFVASMGSRNVQFTVDDLLKVGVTAKDKIATEQFINDLVDSGRAEKIKGTNKYQIRKNHDFDIARRIEGFNETPQEFGDKLRREGKLPEETIQQLVEDEITKQRKFLPPEEIEPKFIKFNEAIEEGRTNVFAKELKKILNERGLSETGVVVSNDILSTSALARTSEGIVFDPRGLRQTDKEGEYDRNTDIIFLSLNAVNPDGNATPDQIKDRLEKVLDHKMIHAFREKDLINEKEYQYLRKEVKRKKVPEGFDSNFKGRTFYARAKVMNETRPELVGRNEQFKEELYVEEAIAEMYRARNFKPDIAPKANGILNKIVEFFRSMGQAMRTAGFKKATDVFSEIESGRVGARARGEIRTLRELDKLSPEAIDAPVVQEFEEGEAPVYDPQEVAEDYGENTIGTPVSTFEDVEADTDPITGVVLTPSGLGRSGKGVYNKRTLTPEELEADRRALLAEFGNERHDTISVLESLSKKAPSKDYKVIADRLLTQLKKFKRIGKLDLGFTIISKGTQRLDIHRGKGLQKWLGVSIGPFNYNGQKTMQIYINDTPSVGVSGVEYETVLHELVHQATQAAVFYSRSNPKLRENVKELEKIRTKLRQELAKIPATERDFYVKYGLSNIDELLAVGLTDREFQKFMESIPYSPRGKKSLWDKFTETIRKLLNIPAKQGTAFSEFLSQAGKITSLSQQQISDVISDRATFSDITLTTPENYAMGRRFTPEQQQILNQLSEIEGRIMPLESEKRQESALMSQANLKKLNIRLNKLYAERDSLQEQFDRLPSPEPGQISLFSRVATDTKPPYMDFNRKQIRDFSSNKVGFYNGVEIPLTHVARMRVEDFLKLTTVDQEEINEIITAGPTVGSIRNPDAIFDPELADTAIIPSLPNLEITGNGQVISHEGRHRVALIGQGGGRTVPVFINFPEGNVEQNIPNPSGQTLQEQGVTFLRNQQLNDFTVPINRLGKIAPLHRDSAQTKDKLDYAVEVASQPDLLASSKNIPLFSRGTRFADNKNTNENIKLREATEKAVEIVKRTPRGEVPYYNVNASDVALKAAIDFNEDASVEAPDDIPRYSRPILPEFLQGTAERIGQPTYKHKKSWGARLLDETDDSVTIQKAFSSFRTALVDKLDPIVKAQIKLGDRGFGNEEAGLFSNLADTSAIAALRLADRARGIFNQMLLKGVPVDQIDGMASLTKVVDFKISTRYNPFIDGDTGTGGFMQFTAPLFMDPSVDLEGVFGVYGKLKKQKSLNEQGKEIASPITSQDLEQIAEIEARFPVVVEVYNNYQEWNNALISFAESKGLLSPEQAELWREHSSYYPFYRDMVDETGDITAPKIGGGMLPNNPLNINMKGSEKEINVPPLEAIARNSLSILTASMKNDGAAKLMRDFVDNGMARKVSAKEASGQISIPVFENGRKEFYLVDDYEVYEAMRGIGGVSTDLITKILQMPAGLLRDTVTRDPGFVVVNLLRDTLSSAVTAGNVGFGEGKFTPIYDTFKGMMDDMSDLERFGIIGGYDFANDEGEIVELMARARRKEGLSPDNGITAKDAFFKIWDGLGGLTTKSDGATRLGVYKAVYNDLKERGATEAQAQSEAAYQALEIINFGRRGNSVLFRYLTSAVPFLNARIQGLDVLWRSASGQYSAIAKQREGETLEDVQSRIIRGFWARGSIMFAITAAYYAMVSDTDEYKEVKREVRDDNWLIPTPFDYTIKLPIPFEVGMLFKALPERLIDEYIGRQVEKNPFESIKRQIGTSANVPFLSGDIGIQAVKPLFEIIINRNSWTNTEIVPYYKQKEEPAYQARQSTNEIARVIGEFFNISPMKLEHLIQGYTGTLGGYLLDLMDVTARSVTGTPLMPSNINSIPVIKRFLIDNDKGGGLQQSFYELREEVIGATTTLNDLRTQGRMDELAAYREHHRGLFNVKGQVNAINRFMENWRKQRDRLLRRTDISPMVKADMLRELEARRDKRLAIVPALRQKADVPRVSLGN